MNAKIAFATLLAVMGATGIAGAQSKTTLPSETLKPKNASTGNTEIAKGGFATGAAPPSADDPRVATEAAISLGGLFTSGNARTLALTSHGTFRIRRYAHQFGAQAVANYARAGKTGEPVETTVQNLQGMLRYDYFFTNDLSLFFQTTGRHDKFQGLDARLNFDPGVAYYFVNTKKQQLRVEAGYDLQHDVRLDEARVQTPETPPAPGEPPLPLLDKTQTLHNARLFAGYENKLYEEVSFVTSLEYLQNLSDLGTYRLIYNVGIKSNISDKFAIATTYVMRFENKPLPSVEKADSIASVNLVYTLF